MTQRNGCGLNAKGQGTSDGSEAKGGAASPRSTATSRDGLFPE